MFPFILVLCSLHELNLLSNVTLEYPYILSVSRFIYIPFIHKKYASYSFSLESCKNACIMLLIKYIQYYVLKDVLTAEMSKNPF